MPSRPVRAPTRTPRTMRTEASVRSPRRPRVGAGRVEWIEVDAPGKVNLTLAVLGPRADGYHDLHSVVAPIRLADRITLQRRAGAELVDELHCAGLPIAGSAENLVLVALRELRAELGDEAVLPHLSVVLEKRLPAAAGLGGGSSDAAAALLAANALWGSPLSGEELERFSGELGSDIPFFVRGSRAAVARGRGEQVEACACPAMLHVVVVRPPDHLLLLVPPPLREAAIALGAQRWKVITFVTLRAARRPAVPTTPG